LDKKGNVLSNINEEDRQKIFMFDTGAQHILLAKSRAERLGYSNCKQKGRIKVSVGGSFLWCSKVEIPDIIIAEGIVVHNPIVLVPDDYTFNKSVLGQDILQLFNYYMDNHSHNIYFDMESKII
jgi:predicted aspartyl protease